MDGHVDPGEVVVRLGIARRSVTARGRWVDSRRQHRDAGAVGVGQQAHARCVAGPSRVAVRPQVVGPVGDRPALVDARGDVADHGRAERFPGELVGAAPLHPHMAALRVRCEQRGIHRRVVGRIVAVAAGPLHVVDHDRLGRQIQRHGDGVAQGEHALAVAPHLESPVRVARDGTAGADGRVREEGAREGCAQDNRGVTMLSAVIAMRRVSASEVRSQPSTSSGSGSSTPADQDALCDNAAAAWVA